MITRAKSGIFKPKIYNANLETEEPSTYQQSMKDVKWMAAMKEEYDALIRNKTCTFVPLPANKNVVGCNGHID